jgi:hypothetical protein
MSNAQKDPAFENQVKILASRITEEIFIALGWKRSGFASKVFAPLFRLPTRRFARVAARFENDVVNKGPRQAAVNALPQFAMQATADGIENIPRTGPVLIVSNHPGGLDSLALVSSIPRPEITALVSDIPFLNSMEGIRKHVIFVDFKAIGGMTALREAVSHLKNGGTILLFAHGDIEPEPAVMTGARRSIEEWSPSIEVMLRKVPETQLIIATISNVLLARFVNHPLTRVRKDPTKRQKLGEFLQIIMQMLSPRNLQVHAQITFSLQYSVEELGPGRYMPVVISKAQQQLDQHLLKW